MDILSLILKSFRKTYRICTNYQPSYEDFSLDREYANKCIKDLLTNDAPCMISRIGSGEMGILTNYIAITSNTPIYKKIIDYITKDKGLPWWDKLFFESMRRNAGIFPETIETLRLFSEEYLKHIHKIDLIGSFNAAEKLLSFQKNIIRVHLECLYPFFVNNPWTEALKDKKVLVVHPFEKSIHRQYKNRKQIFSHPEILPNFDLITIRAVQSNAGNTVKYSTWFEALDYMKQEISNCNFDICILGCGAYGLPLAAHVKDIGKKAIHLGGGSQLLFGIKGRRWDNNSYKWAEFPTLNTNYSSLYNEHWIRPNADETPISAKSVEGACYW